MKKNWIWIVVAIALVGLIVGASILYNDLKEKKQNEDRLVKVNAENNPLAQDGTDANNQEQQADPNVTIAPDFTVYTPDGNPVKLSDLRGKPVVLNLWTEWCVYCKEELPDFQKMYEKYGNDVHFMIANVTGLDEQEKAESFMANNAYTFPVYYDLDGSMQKSYYLGSVPTTYFINAKGELVTYASGQISADVLEQGINMCQ